MTVRTALVLTSISPPNAVLRSLADGAKANEIDFIVIGDENSPASFHLEGCRFLDVRQQRELGFAFAGMCPTRRYSRKNIGYLLALRDGAEVIVETDDDNYPRAGFWAQRERSVLADGVSQAGWVNAYKYFTDEHIWPRGFPLNEIHSGKIPTRGGSAVYDCPIQQALSDENPDVDALYRLILPLPRSFSTERPIALSPGTWCPFNSQNTTWFREAAALLYLPSFCSFRMTDIWRSFIAQRVAWECGWSISFHSPTVWQERNEHDLMKDFEDEIPGYLQNSRIAELLAGTRLAEGARNIFANVLHCYEALAKAGILEAGELPLVSAWLRDIEAIVR